MRKLIYVPIIHMSADLDSLAKDVNKRGIAGFGEEFWERHRETISGFWDVISHYFDSIDVSDMKIYQDGMIAEGEVGQKIVEEGVKSRSKNYELISKLLKKGDRSFILKKYLSGGTTCDSRKRQISFNNKEPAVRF